MTADIVSITLAAGSSARMPPELRPKACVKIGGVTVIERALRAYEAAGIARHVIVVNQEADRIREALAHRDNVTYAVQETARGTGDAARYGLDCVAKIAPESAVLISAGDKIIGDGLVSGLIALYAETGADFSLVAGRSEDNPSSGRIIERDGVAEAIVEVPDIQVRRLANHLREIAGDGKPLTRGALHQLADRFVASRKKLTKAVPMLMELIADGGPSDVPWEDALQSVASIPESFELPGGCVAPDDAYAAPWSNLSLYYGGEAAIRDALGRLKSNNVQGEWYMTDIIEILAAEGRRVSVFRLSIRDDLLAFNTPEELEYVRRACAERGRS
jgi:bifunctional N-acetylglucosamine-1-phosphate-uridyltransferase/glucosamine-1-phosphate-acetyltransferase GlmU-like protein